MPKLFYAWHIITSLLEHYIKPAQAAMLYYRKSPVIGKKEGGTEPPCQRGCKAKGQLKLIVESDYVTLCNHHIC